MALQFARAGAPDERPTAPVVIGEVFHIRSKVLNEDRELLVARPPSYGDEKDRYPVLYLLDGETHFRYATGTAEFLAASERIPKLLVIGIVSGSFAQRTRDLTPPSTAEIDNRFSPGNGGADMFLSFLSDELIPYVERSYRTRPYRLLVGHSFGGLFAIYALASRPELCNAYIAADPTLGWNRGAIMTEVQALFSKRRKLKADLYFTATAEGGTWPADNLQNLADILARSAPVGFRWKHERLNNETHASIPLPTLQRGLDTVFDGWHLTDPLTLFDQGGIEAIHRHFRDGGRRCGYRRTTPPLTVSMVVAALVRAGRLEEAGKVLLHDPEAYPAPWNQLDALARAWAERGNTGQAIRYYRQSLKANPGNEWARQKLKEIGR